MSSTEDSPTISVSHASLTSTRLCFALLGLALAGGLWVRSGRPVGADGRPGVEASGSATGGLRIDPNTADWRELTLLPGIGEGMARRIVEYRTVRQAELGAGVAVYGRLEDLDAVRGLGPKRLASMADMLLFPQAKAN